MIETRTWAWPALLIIAAVCLQSIASVLASNAGLGGELRYRCEKCGAIKTIKTGRFSRLQLIYVRREPQVAALNRDCQHSFHRLGEQHGDGPIPPLAVASLYTSYAAFAAAGGVALCLLHKRRKKQMGVSYEAT